MKCLYNGLVVAEISGGLSQHFAGSGQIRSLQKTKLEPGRVTAQRIILLLPSLINNI